MTQQPVSPPNAPGKEHSNTLFTLVLIRGIAALVLGMALFLSPGLTGRKLAIFFVITVGVWMIFDGGLSIAAGIKEKKLKLPSGGWVIFSGVAAIIAGIGAIIFPMFLAVFGGLLLLWFLAFGLLVRGAGELFARGTKPGVRVLGALNILFGIFFVIVIVASPDKALTALLWTGGIYGIVFGIGSIVAAGQIKASAN